MSSASPPQEDLSDFVGACLYAYSENEKRVEGQLLLATAASRMGLAGNDRSLELYVGICSAMFDDQAPEHVASLSFRVRCGFMVWLAAVLLPDTPAEHANALRFAGVHFIGHGKPLLARYLLREALRHASSPTQVVDVLTQLAVACDELGGRHRALRLLSLALRSYDVDGIESRPLDACLRLNAAARAFAGDLRTAIGCLDIADGLCADVYSVSPLQARVAWTIAMCLQAFDSDPRDRTSLMKVMVIALNDIGENTPLDQRFVDVDMLQHGLNRTPLGYMALLPNMLTIRLAREVPALALDLEEMAIALNNLGNAYLHLEWNDDARRTFLETLELSMDDADAHTYELLMFQRMHAFGGIGFSLYNDGKESPADRARPAFEAAAMAFTQAAKAQQQCTTRAWFDGRIWVCAGLAQANLGFEAEALNEFAKALLAGHDNWAERVSLDRLGDFFVPESDTRLKLLEGFRLLRHFHASVLFGKAAVHSVHRESLPSIDVYLSAQYVRSRARTHRELIESLTYVGRHNEAEQAFDLLKEDRYGGYAQRSDVSMEVESLVAINRAERTAMERCGLFGILARVAAERIATDETIEQLAQALGALDASIESCVDEQRRNHGDVNAAQLENIARSLGRHAASVRYLVLPTVTQIHVIADGVRTLIESVVTFDALSQLAFQMRQQCRSAGVGVGVGAQEGLIDSAQRLYDFLIAPLQQFLAAHVDHLYVQVDSPLEGVPFAALFDGTGYLVERYAVSYVNSAGSGAASASSGPSSAPDAEVTVFTCSDLPGAGLPGAALEGAAIEAGLARGPSGLRCRSFTHAECTGSALLDRLGIGGQQHGVVHLGTHAEFNATSDQLSVLELADGGLSIRQLRESLANSGCDVGLFVLSACGTGRQDMDVEGFSVTLLKAGVRSVVSSLWETLDASAPGFFERFYAACRNFSSVREVAGALRQAQLAMLSETGDNGAFRHPAHWAPYVLTSGRIG